jgi:hypothetical protein
MTDPDYKIEECFDEVNVEVYFRVIRCGSSPYLFPPKFKCLTTATKYVRMLRKYSQRIYHYVEE